MSDLSYFVDRTGALGKLEKTPQGGYRANATIARDGILLYSAGELRRAGVTVPERFKDHDRVRVHNPIGVLEAALESLNDSVVTLDHPDRFVNPDTYASTAKGNVVHGSARVEGKLLKAKLTLQAKDLISAIETGKAREISAGYGARTVFEEGTTDDGEAYDAIRTEVLYNHVAVVPCGRAGSRVCLALDSTGSIPSYEETSMTIKIKGADVPAEKLQAAVDALSAEAADAEKRAGQIEALTVALQAANDALAAAKAELAKATAPEAIDAAVAAKLTAIEDARKAEELKVAADARREKAKGLGIDVEGKTQDFVDGALELAERLAAKDDGASRLLGKIGTEAPKAPAKKMIDPREDMIKRNASLAKR